MATKARDELVGKRFLVVSQPEAPEGSGPSQAPPSTTSARRSGGDGEKNRLKLSQIANWHWRGGVVRCASHAKDAEHEIQVQHHDKSSILFVPDVFLARYS
jgi:hypothetical protein